MLKKQPAITGRLLLPFLLRFFSKTKWTEEPAEPKKKQPATAWAYKFGMSEDEKEKQKNKLESA